MSKYTLRAYEADGSFAFGGTLSCPEDRVARARFSDLPLGGRQAELLHGRRRVATREADAEAGTAARPPLARSR